MKTPLSLLLLTSLLFSTTHVTANNIPQPEIIKINSQVYALLGPTELPNKQNRGYMVNSTIFIGSKGVILVDTGFTDEIGQHLKTIISGITNKPVTHVINTHHHGDHTLGNSVFADAEIISAENCKTLIEKTGYEWIGIVENMTGNKYPDTKPLSANTTYKENTRTKVSFQGISLELWAPHGSHTPGDLIVHAPQFGVLVAGDILVHTIVPNFRDGIVRNWIETLNQISNLPLKTIIPGHGPLMKTTDVKTLHRQMQALYSGIEAGYKQGLMDSEIRNKLDLSAWKKLKHFHENMGGNISRTYLEVESANF